MTKCEGGVMAHGGHQPISGGSIPASSLHYWFNETNDAKDLVERFHYSHRWPSNVQLVTTAHLPGGLFGNKGAAAAAVVFSIPATRWSLPVWELSRLVRGESPVPLSAVVAAGVRKLKQIGPPLVVSFADWTQNHHGGIYQACGWNYDGLRKASMDGITVEGRFIPGRSANSAYGTRSPSKLAELGIKAAPHYDDGKHLYWLSWGKEGKTWADKLGLRKAAYPKPDAGVTNDSAGRGPQT